MISIAVGAFWFYTSALYNMPSGDGGVFLMMGRGILEGKIPYVDLFYHKGPIIFFLEAAAQIFDIGYLGVWILEVLVLFASLTLFYRTVRLLLPGLLAFPSTFLFLLYAIWMFEGGNMAETYCLPFSVLMLYLLVRAFTWKDVRIKPIYGFAIGVSMAFQFLTRPTNTAITIGVLLSITAYLAISGEWRALTRNYGAFIFGLALIFVPVCLFFGYHKALNEFIYGAFLYNFSYLKGGSWALFFSEPKVVVAFVIFLIAGIAGGITCFYEKQKDVRIRVLGGAMILLTLLCAYVITMSKRPYLHYVLIGVPVAALGVALVLRRLMPIMERRRIPVKGIWITVSVILLAVGTLWTYQVHTSNLSLSKERVQDKKEAAAFTDMIPEKELNSVWGYNVDSQWYLDMNVIPCFKYFYQQEWQGQANPKISRDIVQMLKSKSPKWIVTKNEERFGEKNVQEIIEENYDLVSQNEDTRLYSYKYK